MCLFVYLFISAQDYKSAVHGILPSNEVQIYTWPDATLREITDLLKDALVPNQGKQRNSHFEIALVYPDRRGEHKIRPVSILLLFLIYYFFDLLFLFLLLLLKFF